MCGLCCGAGIESLKICLILICLEAGQLERALKAMVTNQMVTHVFNMGCGFFSEGSISV